MVATDPSGVENHSAVNTLIRNVYEPTWSLHRGGLGVSTLEVPARQVHDLGFEVVLMHMAKPTSTTLQKLQPWLPAIATLCIGAMTIWINWHSYGDNHSKVEEDRLAALIDSRISANPGLSKISDKLDRIESRLAVMEGWKQGLESKIKGVSDRQDASAQEQLRLKNSIEGQRSIARLMDPARILATIRAEIQIAERSKTAISEPQLVDYRNAIKALPENTYQYWQTIAAIINYQSLLNQLAGYAPDPEKVSKPCALSPGGGDGRLAVNNFFGGRTVIRQCNIDLSHNANVMADVTFIDCVIRFSGTVVGIRKAAFINCRFILDLPPQVQKPVATNLLLALADGNQRRVTISN